MPQSSQLRMRNTFSSEWPVPFAAGASAVPERMRMEAMSAADSSGLDTDMELAPEDVPAEVLEAERAAQEVSNPVF